METITRYFKPPKTSFFLLGPRGTGKSTWVRSQYPNALYIDLLSPEAFRTLSAKPERLSAILEGSPDKKIVIIDEIQKVPALLTVVHQWIEKKAGHQFILTGSSARKLKKTGVDLLAGRALQRTFYPFVAWELGEKFKLDQALQWGLLPLLLNSPDPGDSLQAYLTLYLREEIQNEGLVRNLGHFSRFLETLSFSNGSVLNISNISRECEIERKVVEGYVGIVEDLMLGFRLGVFSKKSKRATIKHSKFYLFDTGVFRALRPKGPLDKPETIEGAALEALVAQHLKALIDYENRDNQLYFWKTQSGREVDFILYGPATLTAIEVKNSNKVRPEDLRSLRAFRADYPSCKLLLLYRGKERLKENGVLCIPCEEFLINPFSFL